MNRVGRWGVLSLALILAAVSRPPVAVAQEIVGKDDIKIRKIEGKKVGTPQYQLTKGQFVGQTRDWFVINTTYRTDPKWIDELTFTYYVIVRNKDTSSGTYTMFRGEVTYVNIEKGDHKSDMYLHPSTLARYGDVEGVAVVVSALGQVVAIETIPAAKTRWWEQRAPVDGYVLNRMQTPFAMINFDDYEAIKMTR